MSADDPLAGLTEYDLRHLTTHLIASGRHKDLHRLLELKDARGRNARLEPGDIAQVIREWRQFLNEDAATYRIYHRSFAEFLDEQENLRYYHDRIAAAALAKIDRFGPTR